MPRQPFTLEQVRSFVAVAETEHISRAAASLFLTQGAVTQQIRNFELATGLQLLEHTGRRVRLTEAGRALAETCRAALRAIDVLEDSARSMKELSSGSLHVGASPTCATYYLPSRLAEFTQLHPGVKLTMAVEPTSDLNRQVVAGTIDCAMVEGAPDRSLVSVVVAHDDLVFVVKATHPLAALERVTPDDLAAHRYIRRGPTFSAEQLIREVIGTAYDRTDALNLGHPEYVRAAVTAGLGFAALPRLAVAADITRGVVKELPIRAITRPISAIRRAARGGPAQEAFWSLLTSTSDRSSSAMAAR